mmetsp:Transcript_89721/g.256439  ORF Transcript_89721/g.256439 Transcript_89721/m.256439 type:complete len:299 (+) Transcript_89721:40-936(+)
MQLASGGATAAVDSPGAHAGRRNQNEMAMTPNETNKSEEAPVPSSGLLRTPPYPHRRHDHARGQAEQHGRAAANERHRAEQGAVFHEANGLLHRPERGAHAAAGRRVLLELLGHVRDLLRHEGELLVRVDRESLVLLPQVVHDRAVARLQVTDVKVDDSLVDLEGLDLVHEGHEDAVLFALLLDRRRARTRLGRLLVYLGVDSVLELGKTQTLQARVHSTRVGRRELNGGSSRWRGECRHREVRRRRRLGGSGLRSGRRRLLGHRRLLDPGHRRMDGRLGRVGHRLVRRRCHALCSRR